MVNYELFKSILYSTDEGYIEDGDRLDIQLMDLLGNAPIVKMKSLFKKGDGFRYFVEHRCSVCGEIKTSILTKSKVFKALTEIKNHRDFVCDDCNIEAEERRKKQIELNRENDNKLKQQNTLRYIDTYLDHCNQWTKGVKTYDKLNELKKYVNYDEIADYIKGMDYHEFLETPYWKAISEYVKYRSKFHCIMCNKTENLNVHHRTYDIHGYELQNINSLVCLCKDCHEKFHNV